MPTLLPSALVQVIKGGERQTQNEQFVTIIHLETEFKKDRWVCFTAQGWTPPVISSGSRVGTGLARDEEAQVCGAVKRLCITEHPLSTSGVL